MWACCGAVLAAGTALAWPWIVDEKRWPLNAWLGQLKKSYPPTPFPVGSVFVIIY